MKITARLAHNQLKANKKRTIWTLIGIILSTAMITAVYGFVASGDNTFREIMGEDYFNEGVYRTTIISIGAFLSVLIIIAAAVVVSNAFRVSAGERISQFGILKSAGATKKQIFETIIYEGLSLSVVGVPAGIAVGLLVNLIGIQIANFLLADLNRLNTEQLNFYFILSWQAIVLSVAVSFMTVLLSVWFPARKAARIAAIDAIRGAGEVKVNAKKIKTNLFIQKLFKFEGVLASKSLKRSKRNFRSTVISLTISIVLFIAVSGLASQMGDITQFMYPNIDATVIGHAYSVREFHFDEDGIISRVKSSTLDSAIADDITSKLREFPGLTIIGSGGGGYQYNVTVPRDMIMPRMRQALRAFDMRSDQDEFMLAVTFVVADPETYAELCNRAGVPVGSNLLINQSRYAVDGKRAEFTPFVFNGQTLCFTSEGQPSVELTLHAELGIGEVPNEVFHSAIADLNVIVPHTDAFVYLWFADISDIEGFIAYADTVLHGLITMDGETEMRIEVLDINAATTAVRNTARAILVFIYGFVGMLTLIGLTNVISTISTNVRSRSREFAVLKSVGMTHGGLKRMLNLESILCSVKSLLIGVPLGTAASWVIYRLFMYSVEFAYDFPWAAIMQSIIGV
ncbi:MAG: ABC transporter permease, partial [Oscillospiraceae bacterium]|nr:ABC transporter permease [Oscillospiraceae bacterium]